MPNKSFRHHQSFILVTLNIIQQWLCHLHTHFTVQRSNFDSIARKLTSLSPDVLKHVATHLEQEHSLDTLSSTDRDVMSLLNHVNTISARLPGSQSAKIFTQNEIRSYFSEFSLPHLFFTFNPSATHSPIFQVMVGEEVIDLTSQFPYVIPTKERALRLAQDPVAASDFFNFFVTCTFQHLFGWDYASQKSSKEGGILGHLCAFYGTCEFTELLRRICSRTFSVHLCPSLSVPVRSPPFYPILPYYSVLLRPLLSHPCPYYVSVLPTPSF